ncbi:5-oxoprolinase subunit C family protein [Bacillus testis]|uniref:5-oxoprolinase subunit C family protein n=1 Tax=Bacillus testis TaxID=1622072 RepID=UPI00067EF583|nr:biotin-dependent carboxyltransferase family protein [Bacillus testis]
MLTILKPGLMTTIQDLGRYGYQKYGIIVSGAMDPLAHRIANLLVQNEENASTIEITLVGPRIRFEKETIIALSGGDLSPSINAEPVKIWAPLHIKSGDILDFGKAKTGCRMYLAIQGGLNTPAVLDSTSTYLRAGIGGFHGRKLKSGDQINYPYINNSEYKNNFADDWSVSSDLKAQSTNRIRVMKGRQYDLFQKESQHAFFTDSFNISNQSDRMGYRLNGSILSLKENKELISEGVSYGSIQVPSDGNPIILLADRQTIGGYPKIAQIASVDFSVIAQKRPGEKVYFEEISHEEAQRLYWDQEEMLHYARKGIQSKYR